MSNVTLKLDTGAMQALFPEGSEARVELQRAVVANFISQHIKPSLIGAQVESMVKAAKEAAVKEALVDLGVTTSWGGGTQLSDSFKAKLKEQASDSLRANIGTAVEQATTAVIATLGERIKNSVEMKTDDEIRRALRLRVEMITSGLKQGM